MSNAYQDTIHVDGQGRTREIRVRRDRAHPRGMHCQGADLVHPRVWPATAAAALDPEPGRAQVPWAAAGFREAAGRLCDQERSGAAARGQAEARRLCRKGCRRPQCGACADHQPQARHAHGHRRPDESDDRARVEAEAERVLQGESQLARQRARPAGGSRAAPGRDTTDDRRYQRRATGRRPPCQGRWRCRSGGWR